MKLPKQVRIFCPYCKKHTEHSVEFSKKRPRGAMRQGERRFKRKMKGYGSFPKENPKGREKPTRRVDLRYKCSACKKIHTKGSGWRAKKLELVKV